MSDMVPEKKRNPQALDLVAMEGATTCKPTMMRTTRFLAGAASPIARSVACSMRRVRCRGVFAVLVFVVCWIAKAQMLDLCQVLAER